MHDDIKSSLSISKKKIDMNSNEKLGNCLEIEIEMIEKELKMKIYENL